MPSEHDGARARQIEALRQYVAELGTQRERPAQFGVQWDRSTVQVGMPVPAVTAERRRPPVSWLLVTVLLVAVALAGGVFVGAGVLSGDRPPARDPGSAAAAPTTQATTGVALVAARECKTAVDRANSVLAVAVRMRVAVAQHTTVASRDPASFDRALADYRQVVDRCTLRTP
jgi:hypothetical protein